MKASIKLAVIGLAVLGGAAQAANITNTPLSSGGSDLVLFVTDTANNKFYVQDLGVQVSALIASPLTADGQNYDADTNGYGSINESAISTLVSNSSSANLAAFLSTASASTQWTVMGANNNLGNYTVGGQYVAFTSSQDQLANYWTGTNVNSARGGTQAFFASVNSATYTNGVSSNTGFGDSATGLHAPDAFVGFAANGDGLGSAQNLYLLATAGTPGNYANNYISVGTLSLSSAGLSYSATPTPIPAALWLLGSGLMGLVGIGRRRDSAVAA